MRKECDGCCYRQTCDTEICCYLIKKHDRYECQIHEKSDFLK